MSVGDFPHPLVGHTCWPMDITVTTLVEIVGAMVSIVKLCLYLPQRVQHPHRVEWVFLVVTVCNVTGKYVPLVLFKAKFVGGV